MTAPRPRSASSGARACRRGAGRRRRNVLYRGSVADPRSRLAHPRRALRAELEGNAPLRVLLLRYNEAVLAQVMQTAACNGRHTLEQRLSRWLLMCQDRVEADELPLTQELLATMLVAHAPASP
jgi:CRP-like cAMP-binding protein